MLSKASIDQNELRLIASLILQGTLGLIAVVYIFNVWHRFLYDIPEWMLLEQTHIYEQIYVFLISDSICYDNFSQTESMLTFDLNIFE